MNEKEMYEALTRASLTLLLNNPPKGFNTPYVTILLLAGRLEELLEYLTEFKAQ